MNRWATFKASFCLSETALGANKTKDIRIAQRDLDEALPALVIIIILFQKTFEILIPIKFII